jgi:hypothetical protein
MANAAMPCCHDQILPVVCRILASLSHCWFVCVFSPVGRLQYNGSPSAVQIALNDIPVVCMPIICHLCASDIRVRTMLTENE